MSLNMQSKNVTRHASAAALFLTFAGVLVAQTPGINSDSSASPELIALSTPHSTSTYSVPDAGRDTSTLATSPAPSAPCVNPARVMPGTPAGTTSASSTLAASNLNTIASVGEQSAKRNSFIGVQPGMMPLDIRMDPTSTQKYGAAPAMVQLRIGRN
jgi:hypothetical protein